MKTTVTTAVDFNSRVVTTLEGGQKEGMTEIEIMAALKCEFDQVHDAISTLIGMGSITQVRKQGGKSDELADHASHHEVDAYVLL
jgi:hypothetical protein